VAFDDWDSYQDLLDKLLAAAAQWSDAKNLEQFDENIRKNCSELVGGDRGHDALCARLDASGDYSGDKDLLFAHVRIVALAKAAADFGLGPEWAGYWISRDLAGGEVYADSRYAPPSAWSPVEVPTQAAALAYDEETGLMYDATNWYLRDGKTIVWPDETDPTTFKDKDGNAYVRGELQTEAAPADLTEQHFDKETGRWRRWRDEDGEFEHYHNDDGVWERGRDGLWHRFHDDARQWLPYDEPSETWLYQDQWLGYDEVTGSTAPTTDTGPTESAAEAPDTDDQILTSMATNLQAAIEAVRGMGVSEEDVSDEEIFMLFEQRTEEMLAAELPEFRELIESD
jgi:hypothetical protein